MIWAEKLPVYRVLSRDCRYDSTKEWICIVNKNRGRITKYFLNKKHTRLMYQGPIVNRRDTKSIKPTITKLEAEKEAREAWNKMIEESVYGKEC